MQRYVADSSQRLQTFSTIVLPASYTRVRVTMVQRIIGRLNVYVPQFWFLPDFAANAALVAKTRLPFFA
jgi:hypothetical protein